MAEQLNFELPARTVLGRDDFFVSPANAMAAAMIDRQDTWPNGKLVLTGPKGAGKTHLTHVWAAQTDARIVAATALSSHHVPDLAQGPVAIEDVPDIAADAAAQDTLFHLHNLLHAQRFNLLMTGQRAPRHWQMSLPDLQSRIEGATHVTLESPDDTLLAAVLAKLFADRQIAPKPDVLPYLLTRMDRSFQAAAEIVDRLDMAALTQRRSLSRKLAAELLGEPEKSS